MIPIIQTESLLSLYPRKDIILLDASNHKDAVSNFEDHHLEGAFRIDVNQEMAEILEDVSVGGRHPLPTLFKFSRTLAQLGILPSSHVVIYDDKSGANAAARLWWMLKSIGLEKVQVLDGGFQEAVKVGYPIASGKSEPFAVDINEYHLWTLPIASLAEVIQASQDLNQLIIDVREKYRYNGESEPIDLVAGHIPNAINIPYIENLGSDGKFLPPLMLKAIYEEKLGETQASNVIIHCGSGVTACHTILAITYAGLPMPKLYVGSWSEWSRQGLPIQTEL